MVIEYNSAMLPMKRQKCQSAKLCIALLSCKRSREAGEVTKAKSSSVRGGIS